MRLWYACRSEPGQEFSGRTNIENKGFPAFVPAYWKKYQHGNVYLNLLFKGYIFVALDNPVDWVKVLHTNGVKSFLTSYATPNSEYQMPNAIASKSIESLRLVANAHDELISRNSKEHGASVITRGCHVKVLSGVWKDEACAQNALVDWTDDQRTNLILNVFNRRIKVEFHVKDLELIA